jgi:pyridoxine 4-dehydrogenase
MAIESAGTFRIGGDLPVRRLGFGAMRITGDGIWGPPRDPAEAKRVLARVVELGINLIDTADSYGPEISEQLIAEALHPYPAGLVIATKGGLLRPGPGRWTPDGRPEHLRRVCETSLRLLKLERIDLYQHHAPDPDVPLEDSLGALVELQREGKIRHIGVSNYDVAELERAVRVAKIVSVQNRFNLTERSSQPVLDWCEKNQIAFIPWQPLGMRGVEDTVRAIAARHGALPQQVALAWLLQRSPVTLPIPGTGSVTHLEENAKAADLRLSEDELRLLDSPERPGLSPQP